MLPKQQASFVQEGGRVQPRSSGRVRWYVGRARARLRAAAKATPCGLSGRASDSGALPGDGGSWLAETLTSPPDIVINCAGAGTWRFLAESTMNDLKLNLSAPFWAATWTSRALLPGMVARGSGCIVNVQSPAAYCAVAGATGYVAGRWALRGLSEAMRADVSGTGVLVQVRSCGTPPVPMACTHANVRGGA